MGIAELTSRFEKSEPEEILRWALDTYHPRIALASSFGAEDMVLIDVLSKIRPDARIFTLDTGRLHPETYEVMDVVKSKYGFKIDIYFPETKAVEDMVNRYGLNLFYESVDLRRMCCRIRKVEPLTRAVSDLSAWITGLRREQTATRSSTPKVEIDKDHGDIVKVNPLVDWTTEQVWDCIREHNVPYNKLHDRGYPSIGCAPCTRAVMPGQDLRAGRWWWERGAKECGLHYQDGKAVGGGR